MHHQRALMAYLPRRYDGRVDLLRARPAGSRDADPTRGWTRVTRELVPVFVDTTRHGRLLTHLPGHGA